MKKIIFPLLAALSLTVHGEPGAPQDHAGPGAAKQKAVGGPAAVAPAVPFDQVILNLDSNLWQVRESATKELARRLITNFQVNWPLIQDARHAVEQNRFRFNNQGIVGKVEVLTRLNQVIGRTDNDWTSVMRNQITVFEKSKPYAASGVAATMLSKQLLGMQAVLLAIAPGDPAKLKAGLMGVITGAGFVIVESRGLDGQSYSAVVKSPKGGFFLVKVSPFSVSATEMVQKPAGNFFPARVGVALNTILSPLQLARLGARPGDNFPAFAYDVPTATITAKPGVPVTSYGTLSPNFHTDLKGYLSGLFPAEANDIRNAPLPAGHPVLGQNHINFPR